MSLWRQVTHGFRSILSRRVADREVDEEVRQFMDEALAELIALGASPEDARRTVRLKYGTAHAAREEVRSFGWENTVASILSDLRYGTRLLRRNPGFTTIAVLTLGLGIGSATAIFSVVSPALFEPLPYPHAERILTITDRSADGAAVPVAFGTFRELIERNHSFEALAVFKSWQPTVTGRGEPERLEGQRVSADFFRVLGVQPTLGSGFDRADDHRGGPDVVVLSHGLWRRRFGGDSAIVGREVTLDGDAFRVVGIMPRAFENVPPHPAQLWSLLQYDASLPSFDSAEWGHQLNMVGRVKQGLPGDDAGDELNRIAANPIPEHVRPPWATMARGLSLRSLKETATANVRPLHLALLGGVVLLLAIACVNVTNLLLARGARRRGELAMRVALGAAHGRLVRQLLTEGLLLAVLGGMLGVAVAWVGTGALVALSPPGLPRVDTIAVKGGSFAFALGVTTVIGIVVGLVPVIANARRGVHAGMLETARRAAIGHAVTRRVLVVAEVGLALVLLTGAGLLLRSTQRLAAVPPGFDPSDMVIMQVQTFGQRFADDAAVHRFFDESLDAVRQVPGVVSAALTSQLPLSGDLDVYGVKGDQDTRSDVGRGAYRYAVSPGYFETMGMPIVRGRSLGAHDAGGESRAVVVSETLARIVAPGRDPIGQRVRVGRPDLPPYTIVGVVGDVKQVSLEAGSAAAVYVTRQGWYFADPALWVVVRASSEAATLIPSIKRAIWSVDVDQPIVRIAVMEDLIIRSEAQRRFALNIVGVFAVLALALAVIGLYGVVSGSVVERSHEIGIRAALGASPNRILALVIGQGMTLTALGIALGVAGAALASEMVATLLFGISRLDPLTYGTVAAVLAVAAAIACWVPAARAARVDPASTLRAD